MGVNVQLNMRKTGLNRWFSTLEHDIFSDLQLVCLIFLQKLKVLIFFSSYVQGFVDYRHSYGDNAIVNIEQIHIFNFLEMQISLRTFRTFRIYACLRAFAKKIIILKEVSRFIKFLVKHRHFKKSLAKCKIKYIS